MNPEDLLDLAEHGLIRFRGCAFTICKLRSKKVCMVCEVEIEPGQRAFRPIAERSGIRRCDRLCENCGNKQSGEVDSGFE